MVPGHSELSLCHSYGERGQERRRLRTGRGRWRGKLGEAMGVWGVQSPGLQFQPCR